MITTTSRVSGQLAGAYLTCLRAVLDRKTRLSVAEANYYVTQCLWSPQKSQEWGTDYDFEHAALKYQLYGNPYVQVCRPKS